MAPAAVGEAPAPPDPPLDPPLLPPPPPADRPPLAPPRRAIAPLPPPHHRAIPEARRHPPQIPPTAAVGWLVPSPTSPIGSRAPRGDDLRVPRIFSRFSPPQFARSRWIAFGWARRYLPTWAPAMRERAECGGRNWIRGSVRFECPVRHCRRISSVIGGGGGCEYNRTRMPQYGHSG